MSHIVDLTTLGDKIFPVGTILTFYDTSDHSDFLGLTWARFAAGRMVVGYDSSDSDFATIGNTGGEKKHTLTITEMPKHHHTIVPRAAYSGSLAASHTTGWEKRNETYQDTSDTGGNGAHNNMPPYITAALWRRTA